MNKYVKEFFIRGLMFSGLGPLVFGIVLMILGFCNVELNVEGWQIFLGILSTLLLAFIQAGATVFEQIEEWSNLKSLFWHLLSIYLAYTTAYLVNSWIPLKWQVILIFSALVIVTFLIIWLICYLVGKKTKRKLDSLIK